MTKNYLFGARHARTKTPIGRYGSGVANVGYFSADDGLVVYGGWGADGGYDEVYAAPLVVPV